MFQVYPEFSTRTIGQKELEQLASVTDFRDLVDYSHEKHIISVAKGSFLNYYLWRNIKVGNVRGPKVVTLAHLSDCTGQETLTD